MTDERALYVADRGDLVETTLTHGAWDSGARTGAVVLAILDCPEDVSRPAATARARFTVDLVRPAPVGRRRELGTEIVREWKKIQLAQLDVRTRDELVARAAAPHVREDLGDELNARSQRDEWQPMADLVDEEALRTFTAIGSAKQVGTALRVREGGGAHRIQLALHDGDDMATLVEAVG